MRPVLVLAAILAPCSGLAERIQVPLTLDQRYIETLVRAEVFKGAGDSVRINDDGSGCQFLELRDPQIRFEGGQVILRTTAAARAGRSLGGQCMLLLNWHGQLEFFQTPVVGEDRQSVVLRTSSWRALRPDGRTDNLSTTIARWLEQYLPLQIRQTRVELAEPLGQLEEFLALMTLVPGRLEVDRIAATSTHVAVTIGFDAQPSRQSAQPAQPAQPELRPDELALLEQKLDAVDAFVTYTIRSLLEDRKLEDAELADTGPLFDLLIELRRDLIRILSTPQRSGEDPARALFVTAWNGLNPYLREIAEQQTDYRSAIRYLSFIGAGDALRALDAIGPSAGIEISSDGLRRLARILIPDDPADPLRTDNGVDGELRRSFGFGEPIPPPEFSNRTSWMEWFIPSAVAANSLSPDTTRRLNNWVPKPGDINSYLPMVRDVLQHVIVEQLRSKELNAAYHDVYRSLVYTAAWQESCWRQFVARDDKRVPMQSGSGDVGMMQINPKVWRGFYDLQGLRWDIVYNARAGADILEHHMVKYAVRHREHETTGNLDSLARSTYAAYNGGPRQYNRYRRADASAQEKKIDALFFEKYRKVKTSGALAVAACY